MIPERLMEAKEDHDILDAKMDKCNDVIQSISTALASSNTREKEQSKTLTDIHNNTKFLCEHVEKTCKEK